MGSIEQGRGEGDGGVKWRDPPNSGRKGKAQLRVSSQESKPVSQSAIRVYPLGQINIRVQAFPIY